MLEKIVSALKLQNLVAVPTMSGDCMDICYQDKLVARITMSKMCPTVHCGAYHAMVTKSATIVASNSKGIPEPCVAPMVTLLQTLRNVVEN